MAKPGSATTMNCCLHIGTQYVFLLLLKPSSNPTIKYFFGRLEETGTSCEHSLDISSPSMLRWQTCYQTVVYSYIQYWLTVGKGNVPKNIAMSQEGNEENWTASKHAGFKFIQKIASENIVGGNAPNMVVRHQGYTKMNSPLFTRKKKHTFQYNM